MHFMTESAPSTRERRRTEITRTLVSLARRATAAGGLNGFTVDQLCDEAGVSRRTFFNYFASKEDAVLGIPLHTDRDETDEFFVAMRPRTPAGAVSATLLTDYAALTVARWAALEFDRSSAEELMAAAEREPRLVAHMLDRHRADEARDVLLVARREGLEDGDARAVAAVAIVGHLARLAVPASLDPVHPRPFAEVLEEHLAAAHALFASQDPPSPDAAAPRPRLDSTPESTA
jgi:AcrR family transcriptional regulator